jgi:hypothetical protein
MLSYSGLHDVLGRGLLLTRKLLNQGFLVVNLKSSLRKFYGRHRCLLTVTEYPCHNWPRICSVCRYPNPALFSFMTYHLYVRQTVQWPKQKRTNNDLQNTTQKYKDRGTRTPLKSRKLTQVLYKDKQFLLYICHLSCYSCYIHGDKSLTISK